MSSRNRSFPTDIFSSMGQALSDMGRAMGSIFSPYPMRSSTSFTDQAREDLRQMRQELRSYEPSTNYYSSKTTMSYFPGDKNFDENLEKIFDEKFASSHPDFKDLLDKTKKTLKDNKEKVDSYNIKNFRLGSDFITTITVPEEFDSVEVSCKKDKLSIILKAGASSLTKKTDSLTLTLPHEVSSPALEILNNVHHDKTLTVTIKDFYEKDQE